MGPRLCWGWSHTGQGRGVVRWCCLHGDVCAAGPAGVQRPHSKAALAALLTCSSGAGRWAVTDGVSPSSPSPQACECWERQWEGARAASVLAGPLAAAWKHFLFRAGPLGSGISSCRAHLEITHGARREQASKQHCAYIRGGCNSGPQCVVPAVVFTVRPH